MTKPELLRLSLLLTLLGLSTNLQTLAQKKEALKAIDPSQAVYDTPPPAPPPAQAPGANQSSNNPFGSGIQGQPLGAGKRTVQNPNPQGGYYLPDNSAPPNYGAAPGAPTQAGQGWTPPAQAGGDNGANEKRVARLEQITFGSPYPEHDVEDRLDHLENEVFNKKNTGMPADQRLARLESKLVGQSAFGQTAAAPPPAPSSAPRYGAQPGAPASPNLAWGGAPQGNRPGYYPVTQPQFSPGQQPVYPQASAQQNPPSRPPAYGAPGQPAPYNSAPPYGAASVPPYGAGSAPPYGAGSAPPYGAGSAPPYGAASAPPYGAGSAPPYGAGSAPPYGAGSAPPYGANSAPPYGAGSAPPYGAGSAPPYGAGSAPPYGAGSAPPYGAGSAPPAQTQYGRGPQTPYTPSGAAPFGAPGQAVPYGQPPQQSFGAGRPPQYGAPPFGAAQPPQFGSSQAGPPPYRGGQQNYPQSGAMPQGSPSSGAPAYGSALQQAPYSSPNGQYPSQFGTTQAGIPNSPNYGTGQQPIAQTQAPPAYNTGAGAQNQLAYGGNAAPFYTPPPQTAAGPAPLPVVPSGLNSVQPGPSTASSAQPSLPQPQDLNPAPNSTLPDTAGKSLGLSMADRANADVDNVVKSIPVKAAAGDYFANISKFSGGAVARWSSFPVLVHLPQGSPANWQKTLEDAIGSWGKYIPVRVAAPAETADIEIAWINHLSPRCLGQTNLEVFNGHMRVTVYLLRPSYYLPTTSEKVLLKVAEHEMGHAIGIFGHSADPADLMFQLENVAPKDSTKYSGITARDLNTLRRIYESPALPPGFQSPHPMGWSLKAAKKSN